MNQILSVDKIKPKQAGGNKNNKMSKRISKNERMPKPKRQKKPKMPGMSGQVAISQDVKKIVKFFAIALIIFGVFSIGTASYALVRNKEIANTPPPKPSVTAEYSENSDEVVISVQSSNIINDLIYSWNGEKETKINGNNRTAFQENIAIPTGDNTLTVKVTDSNGQTEQITKPFERQSSIDITIEDGNPNVKVTLKDTDGNEIKYMTFRWNDGQKQQVEINAVESVQILQAMPGENTLEIEAIDVLDNTNKEIKKIQGAQTNATGEQGGEGGQDTGNGLITAEGPKIELRKNDEGTGLVIKASDQQGIDKIDIIVNQGEQKNRAPYNGEQEVELAYPYEIKNGDIFEVTVYNKAGATSKQAGQFQT